jgi:hypothetical protein
VFEFIKREDLSLFLNLHWCSPQKHLYLSFPEKDVLYLMDYRVALVFESIKREDLYQTKMAHVTYKYYWRFLHAEPWTHKFHL